MRMVLCIALLVGATACSIGPQDSPQTLRPPTDASAAGLDPPGPGTSAEQVGLRATLYFVTETDELAAVVRRIPVAGDVSEQLGAVLVSLIEGPSDDDTGGGLRSAIPPTTAVHSVVVDGSVATIDLSSHFASIGGPDELLAVGQARADGDDLPRGPSRAAAPRRSADRHPAPRRRSDRRAGHPRSVQCAPPVGRRRRGTWMSPSPSPSSPSPQRARTNSSRTGGSVTLVSSDPPRPDGTHP